MWTNVPGRAVAAHLEAGRLHLVAGAPEFARPVFLARSPYLAAEVADAAWFEEAVAVLRDLGARAADLGLETRPFPDP